jgi:hypothetical protein
VAVVVCARVVVSMCMCVSPPPPTIDASILTRTHRVTPRRSQHRVTHCAVRHVASWLHVWQGFVHYLSVVDPEHRWRLVGRAHTRGTVISNALSTATATACCLRVNPSETLAVVGHANGVVAAVPLLPPTPAARPFLGASAAVAGADRSPATATDTWYWTVGTCRVLELLFASDRDVVVMLSDGSAAWYSLRWERGSLQRVPTARLRCPGTSQGASLCAARHLGLLFVGAYCRRIVRASPCVCTSMRAWCFAGTCRGVLAVFSMPAEVYNVPESEPRWTSCDGTGAGASSVLCCLCAARVTVDCDVCVL